MRSGWCLLALCLLEGSCALSLGHVASRDALVAQGDSAVDAIFDSIEADLSVTPITKPDSPLPSNPMHEPSSLPEIEPQVPASPPLPAAPVKGNESPDVETSPPTQQSEVEHRPSMGSPAMLAMSQAKQRSRLLPTQNTVDSKVVTNTVPPRKQRKKQEASYSDSYSTSSTSGSESSYSESSYSESSESDPHLASHAKHTPSGHGQGRPLAPPGAATMLSAILPGHAPPPATLPISPLAQYLHDIVIPSWRSLSAAERVKGISPLVHPVFQAELANHLKVSQTALKGLLGPGFTSSVCAAGCGGKQQNNAVSFLEVESALPTLSALLGTVGTSLCELCSQPEGTQVLLQEPTPALQPDEYAVSKPPRAEISAGFWDRYHEVLAEAGTVGPAAAPLPSGGHTPPPPGRSPSHSVHARRRHRRSAAWEGEDSEGDLHVVPLGVDEAPSAIDQDKLNELRERMLQRQANETAALGGGKPGAATPPHRAVLGDVWGQGDEEEPSIDMDKFNALMQRHLSNVAELVDQSAHHAEVGDNTAAGRAQQAKQASALLRSINPSGLSPQDRKQVQALGRDLRHMDLLSAASQASLQQATAHLEEIAGRQRTSGVAPVASAVQTPPPALNPQNPVLGAVVLGMQEALPVVSSEQRAARSHDESDDHQGSLDF